MTEQLPAKEREDDRMKRALFSLMADLLILSLAGCAPSLPTTPTTTATTALGLPTVTPATPIPFSTPTETAQPTETSTVEPTKTPEQLGGMNVAYLDASEQLRQPFPETLQKYLVPSPLGQWETASQYKVADGTTVPWGEHVVLQRSDGKVFVLLPALIRGTVTVLNPNQFAGGSIIFVVYEFPAQGGSNFIIQSFLDNRLSIAPNSTVVPLKGPMPVSWLKSSAGSPIPMTEFNAATSFTGNLTEKQYTDQLAIHQGEMALLMFPIGGTQVEIDALSKIINGQMMGNGKISGIGAAIEMVEPQVTP